MVKWKCLGPNNGDRVGKRLPIGNSARWNSPIAQRLWSRYPCRAQTVQQWYLPMHSSSKSNILLHGMWELFSRCLFFPPLSFVVCDWQNCNRGAVFYTMSSIITVRGTETDTTQSTLASHFPHFCIIHLKSVLIYWSENWVLWFSFLYFLKIWRKQIGRTLSFARSRTKTIR